ncbi:MAG: type II secretion system protein GspG [candidate division Zixibacteria bacterium]|nr:type II secretion system protein GspG [candidate division Zixibacteria bacterium]MDH3936211.1 type II secretion system protein GspG [candidate division Zixibacteria bacterium]MDH4033594.1 type II secretion system protein GspG [candidate division Zixibacteria bacterium]
MLAKIRSTAGYSLLELVIVIVIVAIIATVAMKSQTATNDIVRVEETKGELEQLAWAITGNQSLVSGGSRIDFGYVGDVGALPSNLDDLISNPGGLATWDGPYVQDDFYAAVGGPSSEFKTDAWGRAYQFSGGATIVSTGGGTTITQRLANSLDDLLYNRLTVTVVDLDNDPPGSVYRDSVRLILIHPDGAGGFATRNSSPDANGLALFDSIPIGQQTLRTVYLPSNDTLTRLVTFTPGGDSFMQTQLFGDLW